MPGSARRVRCRPSRHRSGPCDCRLATGVRAVGGEHSRLGSGSKLGAGASQACAHRRRDLGGSAPATSGGRPSCGSKIAWVCRRVSWRIEVACDDADQPVRGLASLSGIYPSPAEAIRGIRPSPYIDSENTNGYATFAGRVGTGVTFHNRVSGAMTCHCGRMRACLGLAGRGATWRQPDHRARRYGGSCMSLTMPAAMPANHVSSDEL